MSPTPAHTPPPPDKIDRLMFGAHDHDYQGVYVIIAASPFIALATHAEKARLTRRTDHPDGSLSLRAIGITHDRLDLAVDSGHWFADRLVDADKASHTCVSCGHLIAWVNKAWMVVDYTTPAGGLTYCPPGLHTIRVGDHIPRKRDGR